MAGTRPRGKHGDRWKAFRSHLSTGRMEVNHAELWAIALALRESVRKRYTLQTHGVTKIAIFSDSQAAIRRTELLEQGPGQPLARRIKRSARTLREAGIETEIHWVPGHPGIPGNKEADRQANLAREGCRTGRVRERVYTSAANWTRRISEAKTAAKAEWEADKCSKHHGYRLKGKAGSKKPIPMNSVKPLTARFYRLKSGHAPVGMYLKRFGHRDDNKCWWCSRRSRTAQTLEHLFRHCSRWKDQQKTLWKQVGKATGWRAGRCRHVKVSRLLSIEKCDQAVMDFLAATDVGKFPPKTSQEQEPAGNRRRRSKSRRATGGGGVRAGGLSLISSLFLCMLYICHFWMLSFFCQKGTTGSRSGAPPSSRPALRRRGLRGCHTLSRVNTV